jgi:hypothetical protein
VSGHDILQQDIFAHWTYNDACGNKHCDIQLLILGAFRYLGRAHTFDDASESTYILTCHLQFFEVIIECGSGGLYEKMF